MAELERWITLEICGRYHLTVHRSLRKAPLRAWQDWFAEHGHHPSIPGDPERLRISFMPIIHRKLSPQGIRFNHIQYWDDALLAIARMKDNLLLRYDPRDISCLFALDDSGRYWRIPYADIRLPAITLAEAKAAVTATKAHERHRHSGHEIVRAALLKREVVEKAQSATRSARRTKQRTTDALKTRTASSEALATNDTVDFSTDPPEYDVEIWEGNT